MKLSIVVPVYNERDTLQEMLRRIERAEVPVDKEIIIVDDGSADGTREVLQALDHSYKVFYHERNLGKGAALRTGFAHATGELVIVQDADLEYDPAEYGMLIAPILKGEYDVVFGSRLKGSHTGLYFWNAMGNKFLTFLFNVLNNRYISDVETGYKVMRREVLEEIKLKSRRFDIEVELATKVAKRGYTIFEMPISYRGRKYSEGKKMNWREGLRGMLALIRYRMVG